MTIVFVFGRYTHSALYDSICYLESEKHSGSILINVNLTQGDKLRKRDDWATWLLPAVSPQFIPAPVNIVGSGKDEAVNGESSQQGLPVSASKSADESKIRDESLESTVNQSEASASPMETGAESQVAAKGGMDKLMEMLGSDD